MLSGNVGDDSELGAAALAGASARSAAQVACDLVLLTKPRVTSMVVLTALSGVCISPDASSGERTAAMLFAVALLVGSANALNCWLERESDKHMARTRKRPLPSGRLDSRLGLLWGLGLAALALPSLLLTANALTALLGAFALLSYVCVYTPLKRYSPWALHVGAVPGALPPLMGYTASHGRLGPAGVALFFVLLVWQLPHFLTIAIFRKDEYARAGLRSLPVVAGEAAARRQAIVCIALLLFAGGLPSWLGVGRSAYAICATLAGASWLGYALYGLRTLPIQVWARRNFVASLLYLVVIATALIADAHG